jgi:mono/diheme cytochrome c family protein
VNRLLGILISLGLVMGMTTAGWAGNPTGYGQAGGEFDITIPRVPAGEKAKARKMKPPFEATPEILAEGKEIFLGVGGCVSCHGPEGKGDGQAANNLPIQPRNFTNPKFKKLRKPGELMWVLKNGSMGQTGKVPGTGMLPVVQPKGFITEEQGWKALLYELSLGGK